MLGLNLWNPHVGIAIPATLLTAFLLGMVHGITPDEHTWPITFSYAVGGYSSRAGMRNALVYSAAFTLQRALASELAYLALSRFLTVGSRQDYIIYVIVGVAMVWAARYVRGGRLPWHLDVHLHRISGLVGARGATLPGANEASGSRGVTIQTDPYRSHAQGDPYRSDLPVDPEGLHVQAHSHAHLHAHPHGGVSLADFPHWSADRCEECGEPDLADPRWWMPALHGFIAGWGFGAFAAIVYTVLAPAMPSAFWGWVPGALFGLGTTVVQVMIGVLVGWLVRQRGAPPAITRRLGLTVAWRTLGVGGVAFVLAGLFGVAFPDLAGWSISSGVHVHNLDHIGLPFLLVVIVVGVAGMGSLAGELRKIPRRPPAPQPESAGRSAAQSLRSRDTTFP